VHVGKRGRMLLFFGALDVIYAVSLAEPSEATRRAALFSWLDEIAPLWLWSAMWAAVGATCLVQAFCRRDGIGFAAAICLKIVWGIVCLGAWLFGSLDRGYVTAAVWLGLAYVVSVISGWEEPGGGRGRSWTRPSSSP
jgi:hypothetical protein